MRKGKKTFETLRHDILDQAMLRRTKQERNKDMHLKPLKITTRKDNLTREEHDRYKSLYMQSCVKLDTFVQAGTQLHNDAHIFDLLTSLRRAVDHPYLIVYGGTLLRLDAHIFDLLTSLRRAVDHPYLIVYGGAESNHMLLDGSRLTVGKAKEFCALCQDDIDDDGEEPKRVSKCWHAFHDQCIREYMQEAPKLKCGGIGCPSCYTKLTIDLGNENDLDSEDEGGKNKTRKASSSGSGSTPKKARAGLRAVADVRPTKGKAPAKAQGVLALPAPPTWIPSKPGEGNSKGARTRAADQKMKVEEIQSTSKDTYTFVGMSMLPVAIAGLTRFRDDLTVIIDGLGTLLQLLENGPPAPPAWEPGTGGHWVPLPPDVGAKAAAPPPKAAPKASRAAGGDAQNIVARPPPRPGSAQGAAGGAPRPPQFPPMTLGKGPVPPQPPGLAPPALAAAPPPKAAPKASLAAGGDAQNIVARPPPRPGSAQGAAGRPSPPQAKHVWKAPPPGFAPMPPPPAQVPQAQQPPEGGRGSASSEPAPGVWLLGTSVQ